MNFQSLSRAFTSCFKSEVQMDSVEPPDLSRAPKSTVIVPLYIYPLNAGTWEPLHKAISTNPDIHFVVVLNPHNGPGASSSPDENYAREIPKLNSRPNVCTVGYVRIDYCKRDLEQVNKDLAKYSGWSTDSVGTTSLGVHGIFFDETPNHYSPKVATYLDSISATVKGLPGILEPRLVIHNPGTSPDARLAGRGPDVTAVVEEGYASFRTKASQEWLATCPYDRDRCAYILHSVPSCDVKRLAQELRHRAEYLFITDLQKDVYCRFGPSWTDFIDGMRPDQHMG